MLTKIEIITLNKKNYKHFTEKAEEMEDGFEKDVLTLATLPWIKGKNFLGGLNDAAWNKIYFKLEKKYPEKGRDGITEEIHKQQDMVGEYQKNL